MNLSFWSRCASLCCALGLLSGLCSAAETADELMKRAHEGRVSWRDFRGFQADVTASTDGKTAKGKLTVESDGTIRLDLRNAEGMEWVEKSLDSVIGHRVADGAAVQNVEFADEDTHHPLGRLIKSRNPNEKSLWRVQGDVMTEVHRFPGQTHMVISVGEVYRTDDNLHLPRSFVTSTWNTETKQLISSRQVHNEWKRVDQWDLPTRITAMTNKNDGTRRVEQIVLSNHWVNPVKAAGEAKLSLTTPLSAPVTSFGGAIVDGSLYVYGGHRGSPHKYSTEDQSPQLLRLNLAKPGEWEVVSENARRTGVALVTHGGKLYRIGGWEAKNSDRDKWDLYSSNDFSAYDIKTGEWTNLTPLPEGRSSHDAAILGSRIYVVGGWQLSGGGDGDWHDTAYVCDLADKELTWKPIAKPPFFRRALAVAAYQGKIYVLGGMDDNNDATTQVSIYDPASNAWSTGPALPGSGFDGFGTSAWGNERGLFCTNGSGGLYQLAADGSQWQEITRLQHPRFFHRLLSDAEGRLVAVGGTSQKGKVAEVEVIQWTPSAQ